MQHVRGLVLPLPTAFDADGRIDEPVIRQMVDHYVKAGVSAIFAGGSMGQGMAMTQEERKRLFSIVYSAAGGRVPVIAHIGTADPYTTIDLGKEALRVGCEAIAIVGPYYYSDRSNDELRAHFRMVCKELPAPTLLYNNPKYQGYPISGEQMARFVEDSPQIIGCKMAKGGVDEAIAYRAAIGSNFKLFAMASSLYPGMLMGITGTISPPLTLCPEIGVACARAIDAGDHATALDLQLAIIELQGALMSPAIRKICGRGVYLAGLRELGFPIKVYPRWPVADVPAVGIERIRYTLAKARAALKRAESKEPTRHVA
jgi:dihydrodipicolinate synthase/N-acetylneuraminate lyase